MARPGGEADKLGNRYEAAFAVQYALECLINLGATVTVEDMDPERAAGSEFTFTQDGREIAHQVKRQNGTERSWTVAALDRLNVWQHAKHHISQGRRFYFSSLTPCPTVREMADLARRAPDLDAFEGALSEALKKELGRLAELKVFASRDDVRLTLQGTWFKTTDEDDLRNFNDTVASFILSGDARSSVLHIGEILSDNLGAHMDRARLVKELHARGIKPVSASQGASSLDRVRDLTVSWHDLTRQTLLSPPIVRDAAGELVKRLEDSRVALLIGSAGSGKSTVLHQAVETLELTATVLAFRLDRYGAFSSTEELGTRLGFARSPVTDLAIAAQGEESVLVIDQLDATSMASGRVPATFDAVADLVREASAVPGMRVVLACREYDLKIDDRIQALVKSHSIQPVTVEPLTSEEIDAAVIALGLDPEALSASQRRLLQNPLNLVLLATVATEQGALNFQSSSALFDAYWEHKLRRCEKRREDIRFVDVVARVADEMSRTQSLAVPSSVFDEGQLGKHADVLVSENVLVRQGATVAFFHETFFDYAFARLWVRRSESLVAFLTSSGQELFRRAQVRQVLQHLAEQDPPRFLAEVEQLLMGDDIRFHIKDTVLGILAALPSPSSETAEVLLRVAESGQSFAKRLWTRFLSGPWFDRLWQDGIIDDWFDGGDSVRRSLAVDFLLSGARFGHTEHVVEAMTQRRDDPDFPAWQRWVSRFGPLKHDRRLFDVFLDAVRSGGFAGHELDMWLSTHQLARDNPSWAVEFLEAYLTTGDDAYALNDRGQVARLMSRDHHGSEVVRETAKTEPFALLEALLPYVLEVVSRTARPRHRDGAPILDEHFSYRFDTGGSDRDFDDALLEGLAAALAEVSRRTPDRAQPLLETLAEDPHDAAQFLLYSGLAAAGPAFADWAAQLLLQGTHRLQCGNVSSLSWNARELVVAISPHLSEDRHQQLEDFFRDLLMPWEEEPVDTGPGEHRSTRYRYAFEFLSAMDEHRLSKRGKLRLSEYRRRFNARKPRPPGGMSVGIIGSPIESAAAERMADDAWLGAMRKYDHDRTDYNTFTGGSRELSRVLQEQVKKDPLRFARLAQRVTADMNPAYGDAILMGLGDAEALTDDADVVYDAVRWVASLGHSDNERWLGQALRRYYKMLPLDLVELIRDRTLHAEDPTDGRPVFTRSDDDEDRTAKDLRVNGINTARGTLAEALGDLLVNDGDGSRTQLVAPFLMRMAQDPVLSVRSCVAHTIAASLKHALDEALQAFDVLVTSDDSLLASEHVGRLIIMIGYRDISRVIPIVERMLQSEDGYVREVGGQVAGYAGLHWEEGDLLQAAIRGDARTRAGLAKVMVGQVDDPQHRAAAVATLTPLFEDDDAAVRDASAAVAPHLRGLRLRPYAALLGSLIASPAYRDATPQLFLTLEHAPDRVTDLELAAAQRFLAEFAAEAGDIRTGAAGDAHYVSELVVRGLMRTRNAKEISDLLDVLDTLLEIGVYGIGDAIATFEQLDIFRRH